MKKRTIWRTVFLVLTAAAVGMELWGAADTDPDTVTWTELITAWVPQTVAIGAATLLGSWLVPHFVHAYQQRRRATPAITDRARQWLRADGKNRAWRTILQGIGAVILVPASDAGVQVVQHELLGMFRGQPFDVRRTAITAGVAAASAALMAYEAYIHRTKVDPSPAPSAAPPAPPPGVSPAGVAMAATPTIS